MIRPGFLTSSDRRELVACVRSQREDHGIARQANAILLRPYLAGYFVGQRDGDQHLTFARQHAR